MAEELTSSLAVFSLNDRLHHLVGCRHAVFRSMKLRRREDRTEKTNSSAPSIVDSMQDQEFVEHKRQYEFHAAALVEARTRGDQQLSQKSARQMLRHLQEMYRLALSYKS